MKVCLVGPGDIRRFPRMYKVARVLVKKGYDVVAVCMIFHSPKGPLLSEEVYDGIRVKRVRPPLVWRVGGLRLFPIGLLLSYLRTLIEALREKANVYHFFHLHVLVLAPIIRGLTKVGAVFYDGLEDYPYSFSRHLHRWLKIARSRFVRNMVFNLTYKLESMLISRTVDFVFTVDSVDGIPYKRYRAVSENVVKIQNVPEAKANIDEELREELIARYGGYKLLVYVGAVHRIRGCLNMVKAMKYVVKEVPDAKLLLIGPVTDEAFMEEASAFIKQHHLEDNVEFLGFVPYDKLHTYLAICHVGLCPYLYIPVRGTKGSSKLFLYMRAGLPVIASDFPGIRALVKDAKCGILVDPTNVRQLANAIIKLLKNPELARQMGENGLRAVRERYNWELEEEKIIRVYRAYSGRDDG
mgnify:CR=1 FL=1